MKRKEPTYEIEEQQGRILFEHFRNVSNTFSSYLAACIISNQTNRTYDKQSSRVLPSHGHGLTPIKSYSKYRRIRFQCLCYGPHIVEAYFLNPQQIFKASMDSRESAVGSWHLFPIRRSFFESLKYSK